MVRCLVTGGSGFIGSHIVDGLLRRDVQVRVIDDLSGNVTARTGEFVVLQSTTVAEN